VFGVEGKIEKVEEIRNLPENKGLDIVRLPTPGDVKQEARKLQAIQKNEKLVNSVKSLSTLTGSTPNQIMKQADSGELMLSESGGKLVPGSVGGKLSEILSQEAEIKKAISTADIMIAKWDAIGNADAMAQIKSISAGKDLNRKELNKLQVEKAQLNEDVTTLSQYSTKDQQDALQAKIDETKGPVKATLAAAKEAWKDNYNLPPEVRNKMMVGYENSANQTDWIKRDKPSTKIYEAKVAEIRRDLKINDDQDVLGRLAFLLDKSTDPTEQKDLASKKAELEELLWSGMSIDKKLLMEADRYKTNIKLANTVEDAEAFWSEINGPNGDPTLAAFIRSGKSDVITGAWKINYMSEAGKAALVDKTIADYNAGIADRREEIKTYLLNAKALSSYYGNWDTKNNTNIDNLIDKFNATYNE